MKSSFKYLLLWQKKRNELPVTDDPQNDWLEMQALLDQHLPVSNKKTSRFKKIKVLPALFIAFSAAAMVYTASRVVINKVNKHHTSQNRHFNKNKTSFVTDSLYIDSGVSNADSITQQAAIQTQVPGPVIAAGVNKNIAESPALTANQSGLAKTPDKNNVTSTSIANQANGTKKADKNDITPVSASSNKNQAAASRQTNGSLRANGLPVNAASVGNKTSNRKVFLLGATKSGNSSQPLNNHHTTKLNDKKTHGVADHDAKDSVNGQGLSNDAGDDGYQPLLASSIHLNFNRVPGSLLVKLNINPVNRSSAGQPSKNNSKTTKQKNTKTKSSGTSNIDWGILTGVNSSGSFTPKAQNANFYGSLPIDLYLGLFATDHLSNKWGINIQTQIFSPQNVTTSYTHANGSSVDSTQSLKITASRKVYNINIPMHVVYNVSSKVSFKAGPVIGFPVKQINTNSTLLPAGIRADSAYYAKSIGILNQTKYEQGVNLGFSGGGSVRAGRFIFEATYLKSITGYKVVSEWGSYKSNPGTLQFTIGFQLSKPK